MHIFLLQCLVYNFASSTVSFCWQFLFALSKVPNKYLDYYVRVALEEANINGWWLERNSNCPQARDKMYDLRSVRKKPRRTNMGIYILSFVDRNRNTHNDDSQKRGDHKLVTTFIAYIYDTGILILVYLSIYVPIMLRINGV